MRAIVQGIRGNRGCGVKRNITGAMLLFLATVSLSNAADKPVWIDNAANISIPSIPAEGIAHGKKFKVEKATIQNGILELRQGQGFFPDYSFMIFTFLEKDEIAAGKILTVRPSDGLGGPHIHFKYKVSGKDMPETEMFMEKFTMRLEFIETAGNQVTGKIYLCLPDENKSFVAGIFKADRK